MTRPILRELRRFLSREDGPTTVEYAVMLMLIVLGCITAIQVIGAAMSDEFNNVANGINNSGK
ncbi:MAG: Flp family type IVb pilin [Planctomycetes bacterium]|nr:Flp family type IVb pilin [Planctomycetota bacterium]